jgi:DNA-binding transcriptional LysR family regulator
MSKIDFDLRQLEIFRKVVDLGSFSKAADSVFLAQASVSERIATLEKSIGTRLLDRLGRKAVPTRAGKILYKHAILLLDLKNTARLEMENFLGVNKGEVNIGGSTIPGEYILPKVIGRFNKEYPDISVILTISDTYKIERLLHEGRLELGIIGARSSLKSIVNYELWNDELVLAVPAHHRWAGKKAVPLHEIVTEPFILREAGSGTLKIMDKFLFQKGLKGVDALQVTARFGTSTAVKEGIKAGLGISILSSRALDSELQSGALKALNIEGLTMNRTFYLIRDRRRISSPLCQAMQDFLKATQDGVYSNQI